MFRQVTTSEIESFQR